ncbi:hypothetical protein BSL78_20696 [Apostichopus japonicus]|uniref:Uncharacterized protein n=1 Tax=Stichopus japonicus TaxID=307972 RepID=A0A2G8K350_STIJA|nr:hypothetical protein BSL78_20696 [Apostichopus japonicus]
MGVPLLNSLKAVCTDEHSEQLFWTFLSHKEQKVKSCQIWQFYLFGIAQSLLCAFICNLRSESVIAVSTTEEFLKNSILSIDQTVVFGREEISFIAEYEDRTVDRSVTLVVVCVVVSCMLSAKWLTVSKVIQIDKAQKPGKKKQDKKGKERRPVLLICLVEYS